jgi:hypothetical protein
MIVIARSGNNNVGHIVTVGLGERPVPQPYFSHPHDALGTENGGLSEFDRDEIDRNKPMQDPFRLKDARLDYFFSITHCSGC